MTKVSLVTRSSPDHVMYPPPVVDEFWQPFPLAPVLAHGQAVAVPSPKQNALAAPPGQPS